jgi:two-component system NtrC family sensor kinase
MNTVHRRAWLPMTIAGVLLLSVLVYVYAKKQGLGESDYFEHIAVLRHVQQLDAQWELDVLKSRIGINTHYDRLADTLAELNQLLEKLDADLSAPQYAAVPELAQKREALTRAIQDKAALIEQFKSVNSVLRNSLAFLPTAAEDVQHAMQSPDHSMQPVQRAHADSIGKLLLASVLYSQSASGEKAEEIEAELGRLESGVQALPADIGEMIDIFGAHVRTVLREQVVVNELLSGITELPTGARMEAINDALNSRQRHSAEVNQRYREYLLLFSAVLAGLLVYAAVNLVRSRAVIHRVNAKLQVANESLEQRVQERTQELRQTQSQLIATARQAGMAEIATNVLHNVGNVLNGVNVSAGLVTTQLRNSKIKGLERAVGLMDDHASDLADFLTSSPKGKLLPGYLRELAQALQAEHDVMAEELGALGKSVDHIKDVIATQQSYAGASRQLEALKLGELVSDALRMNAGALTRHKVGVVNNITGLPALLLDRNRLLLILVNLISNAKQAMNDAADHDACITLDAALVDGPLLRVTVTDNGEGIAPENLTRVFAHGFTTRKTGHGFGLHSCVLAAQEMGGALSVHSDGIGHGARFTLDIPVAQEIA